METLPLGLLGALVLPPWVVALWVLAPVVTLCSVWAMIAATRRGRPTPDPDAGSLVFRYPPLLRWGSVWFAVGILGAVTVMVVTHPPRDRGEAVVVVLSYAMFGAIAAALVWDALRFRLVVGPDGLDCRSPWRGRRFVRWAEVVGVSCNSPLGWIEVRTAGGRSVRVPALLGGVAAFLEACERRDTRCPPRHGRQTEP